MSGDSQWMLPSEIFVYLCELFPSGGKILEFGSGDGTRILAERFDICSIEHDEAWAEKLDTECHLIPIKSNRVSTENGQTGWYDVDEVLGRCTKCASARLKRLRARQIWWRWRLRMMIIRRNGRKAWPWLPGACRAPGTL